METLRDCFLIDSHLLKLWIIGRWFSESKECSLIQILFKFTLKYFREEVYKNVSLLNVISFVSTSIWEGEGPTEWISLDSSPIYPMVPKEQRNTDTWTALPEKPWRYTSALNIVYLGVDHIAGGKSHKILSQHLSLSAGIGLLAIRSLTSLFLFHANPIPGYTFHLWTLR